LPKQFTAIFRLIKGAGWQCDFATNDGLRYNQGMTLIERFETGVGSLSADTVGLTVSKAVITNSLTDQAGLAVKCCHYEALQ